jgi:cardiolipin synthase
MKLLVQPLAGASPLVSAIKKAKSSIEVVIFRFDHKELERAIVAAAGKGIKVHALIAHTNHGGEKSLRKLEDLFLASGITVARTAGDLLRYHDKLLLVDRRVLYILSFNFTHLDIDRSRGFGVLTRNKELVQEAVKLFEADSTRTSYTPGSERLVVSPQNSRKLLGSFLKRAKKQLLIYDPKISDTQMLGILQDRRKAGVEICVIGKASRAAGLPVRKLADIRLHTRTIIRDRRQAFIGSQSLRAAELDSRRELGLILRDSKTVKQLVDIFETDWKAADLQRAIKKNEQSNHRRTTAHTSDDTSEQKRAQKTKNLAHMLVRELNPVTTTVKAAVRKAVDENVVTDAELKSTVKKVVKKVVKQVVKQVVKTGAKQAIN